MRRPQKAVKEKQDKPHKHMAAPLLYLIVLGAAAGLAPALTAPPAATASEARQALWTALESQRDVPAAVDRLLGANQVDYETRAFVEFSSARACRRRRAGTPRRSRS